ncbi:MAG: T9SS type A sorting domain-containing protein [Tannerella sp.]|jgi:hypothetical protein|nr:T9SS type A sorting domain-containing protein [Tannerella sp.]
MNKYIFYFAVCAASILCGVTAQAQLKSKINFTLEQQLRIETLADGYVKQGMGIKEARRKAEETVAPAVVEMRRGDGTGTNDRNFYTPPTDHNEWLTDPAFALNPGSIHVDRDALIHSYKPSELVKKILLKAYTPEDEARIQNVKFLGFQGIAGGGDDWYDDNPALAPIYGEGNRGLAFFTKGESNFEIARGLLLSTGQTWGHEGPNQFNWSLSHGVGPDGVSYIDYDYNSPSFDADLDHIANDITNLGSILEFDFCPAIDEATFEYIFGSEEYPEFVHSSYNDVFGFFVTGPYDNPGASPSVSLPSQWEKVKSTYNGTEIAAYNRFNIAQLPNGMPVGVDWTNWGHRYSSNTASLWTTPVTLWDTTGVGAYLAMLGAPNLHGTSSPLAFNPMYHKAVFSGDPMMELDGITVKLTAKADSLIPGKWYHLKLAIAQVDQYHGDGVFLGNLNLGQGESGIATAYSNKLPDALNELGAYSFYEGCEQTFQVEFDPQTVTQAIELVPKGAAAGNLFAPDGEPLNLLDTLSVGETTVVRPFVIKSDPSFENGEKGYIISISTEAGTSHVIARDTTEIYSFYRTVTWNVHHIMPTTMYPGKLDLNLADGSPNLFRSFDGGETWENARQPLSPVQISNFGDEGTILLCEPNGCVTHVVSIEHHTSPPTLYREIGIPDIPGVIMYPPAGRHFLVSQEDYTFTITPTAGANSGTPVITTNRTRIPDEEGVSVVPNADGSYTVTIYDIREEIRLNIDIPAAGEYVAGDKVWSGGGGQLFVTSHKAGAAKVYNVIGEQVKTTVLAAGETTSVSLPKGVYVITLNGKTYKVVVR